MSTKEQMRRAGDRDRAEARAYAETRETSELIKLIIRDETGQGGLPSRYTKAAEAELNRRLPKRY